MTLMELHNNLERIKKSKKQGKDIPVYGNIYGKIIPIVSLTLEHDYQPNLNLGKDKNSRPMTIDELSIKIIQTQCTLRLQGNIALPVCLEWSIISRAIESLYTAKNKDQKQIVLIC